MGDEQHRQVEALADLLEERQHLRLHRDVERRDRLVGDQELGLDRQRARDADPLALSAGELVRIAAERLRIHAHQGHQPARALERLRSGNAVVERALHDRLADRAARVERAVRVLEDDLDLRAERP